MGSLSLKSERKTAGMLFVFSMQLVNNDLLFNCFVTVFLVWSLYHLH